MDMYAIMKLEEQLNDHQTINLAAYVRVDDPNYYIVRTRLVDGVHKLYIFELKHKNNEKVAIFEEKKTFGEFHDEIISSGYKIVFLKKCLGS